MIGNIFQQLGVLVLAVLFSILFIYQNNRKAKNELNKEEEKKIQSNNKP